MQENKQEKSPIKQNILLYLAKKGVTSYEFYKVSGVTRGILQQNNGISEDNLARFLAYAPDINLEWLLTGRGNMLKECANNPFTKEGDNNIDTNVTVTGGGNKEYYVVIWIEELTTPQDDTGNFTGTVTFNAADGQGVTSTFTV